MGLFGTNRKNVSRLEFREVRGALRSRGFSDNEVDDVSMIFRGDMESSSDVTRGIDAKEIAEGISWMRKNRSKHNIEEKKIGILEEILKEKL
ncbi:MAG TPA: hypothetical protein ENI66_01200 [Candidatus Yonathbacteria bacterium]|nr:hypothetical protein [Candidatus Yonathbacteria bacterium]